MPFTVLEQSDRALGVVGKQPSREVRGSLTGNVATGFLLFGGEGGIRTHGSLRINGFQDRRNRPLCHLSEDEPAVSRRAIRLDRSHHALQSVKI